MFGHYGKKDRKLLESIDSDLYDVKIGQERLEILLQEQLVINKEILAALTKGPGPGTKPVALKFTLGVAKEKTDE